MFEGLGGEMAEHKEKGIPDSTFSYSMQTDRSSLIHYMTTGCPDFHLAR